jgi:hypothetical protein
MATTTAGTAVETATEVELVALDLGRGERNPPPNRL